MNASIRPLIVEHCRTPRRVEPPSAPLPPTVTDALAAIVRDMRDVPRDCFMDRAEMITWLNRTARRVEGVAAMRAALPALPRPSGLPKPPTIVRALSVRDRAEAVFGAVSKTSTKPVERRTITSRKGRAVKVETRRARAGGQMELL